MNIKGVFQIWMKDGSLPRDRPEGVPPVDARGLQDAAPTSRPSTPTSPPAASASTTTGRSRIVRTDLGREILGRMLEDGTIEGRPRPTRTGRHRSCCARFDREPPPLAGVRRAAPIVGVPPRPRRRPRLRHRCALTRRGRRTARDVLPSPRRVTACCPRVRRRGCGHLDAVHRGLGASATSRRHHVAVGHPELDLRVARYGREGLIVWQAVSGRPRRRGLRVLGSWHSRRSPGEGHVQQLITAGFVGFTAWRTYAVGERPAVAVERETAAVCVTRRERQGFFAVGAGAARCRAPRRAVAAS